MNRPGTAFMAGTMIDHGSHPQCRRMLTTRMVMRKGRRRRAAIGLLSDIDSAEAAHTAVRHNAKPRAYKEREIDRDRER